ncbi:hypothetical protein O8B93_27570 [Agrobacterium rhizogenes]|uniref:hypothetical protein n=1 Tax=Rhizobium rhizogenes TaxID=359 RepID=UPI0022B73F6C|nr:hypothetical protein [Rhizobium rhizogenes]MCZ7451325.1 hypothetical protein [Rhizobium rhizogenes]
MIRLRSTCSPQLRCILFGILISLALTAGMVGEARSLSLEPSLPDLPSGVERPAEYAFGDAVMKRDQSAWGAVFDALAQRFG